MISQHVSTDGLEAATAPFNVGEQWGTSTTRIVDECEVAGMPHPQFVVEHSRFDLVLPWTQTATLFRES